MMPQPALCPVCHRPATDPDKSPFCTERCRKIDFFRWWEGKYAIKEELSEELSQQLQNDQGFDDTDGEIF